MLCFRCVRIHDLSAYMPTKSSPLPQPIVTYPTLLGGVIKQRREAKHITQAAASQALGVTQSGYARLESGDSTINVSQLRTIAGLLELAPNELLRVADHYAAQLAQ